MKQIAIKVNNSYLLFPPAAAPFIAHLADAYIATKEYQSGEYKFVKSDNFPEVSFLDTAEFEDAPEPMKKLRQEKEQATKNWSDYYHTTVQLKKELQEAKDKLEKLQKAATE